MIIKIDVNILLNMYDILFFTSFMPSERNNCFYDVIDG